MELPGSLLIWNQLSVEGFFEGHPHIVPKSRQYYASWSR